MDEYDGRTRLWRFTILAIRYEPCVRTAFDGGSFKDSFDEIVEREAWRGERTAMTETTMMMMMMMMTTNNAFSKARARSILIRVRVMEILDENALRC